MKNRWVAVVIIVVIVAAAPIVSRFNSLGSKAILIVNSTAQPHGKDKSEIAVFLTIDNSGLPDKLLSAKISGASETKFVNTVVGFGLAIPGQSESLLSSDGVHIVAKGVRGFETPGQLLPFELTFENAGKLTAKARLEAAKMDAHAMMGHGIKHQMEDGHMKPSLLISMAPKIDKQGWELTLTTENFAFSEDKAGKSHVPGQGHGHVYLNGIKLGRVYGSTFQIGALPTGNHEVMVSLNTNDHRPIEVDDSPVMAKTMVRSE